VTGGRPGVIRLGLAGLSSAMLLFELALTRLSSVLLWSALTPVVIAVSLAAVGTGASWTRRRLARGTPTDGLMVQTAGGTAVALVVALVVCVESAVGFYACVFALPFLLFGAFAGAAYGDVGRPNLTYAADLLGGALGAASAPLLMSRWSPADTAMIAAVVAALSALVVSLAAPGGRSFLVPLLPMVAAIVQFAVPGAAVSVDPYADFGFQPHLVRQTRGHGGRAVATAHDMWARTDLVETDEPWVRYLFTDRMHTARIVRWDGRSDRFPDPEARDLARLKGLPFRALSPESVLVLGAGGGFDVALALQAGARRVDAVEINPAMIRFTRALGGFAGRVYDRPGVRVRTEEARRFVRDTSRSWDVVSLSLLETDPAAARTNTGYESWVLTSEALGEYLGRLNPGGVVAVVQNVEPLAERTVVTALDALATRGLVGGDAFRRLAVLSLPPGETGPFARLVLVARDALDAGTCDRLLRAAAEAGLETQWLPGVANGEPYGSLAAGRWTLDAWVGRSAFIIGPATDDRPFFYDVNRALPLLLVFTGTASVLLLGVVFLRETATGRGAPLAGLGVSALLGAGFMAIESVLIARGQFLLGGPALAVPLVVGGILVFAGGSSLALALTTTRHSRRRVLVVAGTVVAVVALGEACLWPAGVAIARGASTATLAAVVAAMVGAIGLPAGLCFPACLDRWGREGAAATASLYSANAMAAVLGASLATIIAMGVGLSAAMAAGACAYGLAALGGLLADSR
jgi:SAM-dependent methyltransferase